ncbi:thioesterase [Pseudothauera nasutitermitis]|uniref:Thioesterase n=1 Tax=Pseudothauera nasutitermitis TaxID=2565930 RepID=A0A4S4AXJ6_9RHOO|nr:alpha/beta fold hydrolase [Pseudothauera nasutitermitis]THF64784.1 thioesterase [Pseudothauera nasutitermitis]
MDSFLPLCGAPGRAADALHLVLCPFAGGSAGAFRSWRTLRPVGMQVSLAVYPGRDHRMNEACVANIGDLASRVLEGIEAEGIDPHRLVVAGHSMGAQVAYEVCARLERKNLPPRGLVLSACHAPHLRGRRPLSHLEDHAFLEQLAAIGGCAPELLGDPTLWPVFMPMLRADFQATESYWQAQAPVPARRLQTPALLVYGSADEEAWRAEVDAWKAWLCHAQGPVSIAGDHFYVTRRPRAFLEHVGRCFESSLAPIQASAFR